MKAPSPLCLQALRAITFPPATRPACHRRHYAAVLDPPPPTRLRTPPPPEPSTKQPPPTPTFRPTPSGSGLRKKRDDDEDFTPYPLTRPIGMPHAAQPGDNNGRDARTLRQRRDDFHDYDKHLERRAKMTRQIAKPYFRDWSNMRFHRGKVWVANERLFRAEGALYFPNFFGRTLRRGLEKYDRRDGYGGLGRDTCGVMGGKVSVVSLVSNTWAENQAATFCSEKANAGLWEVLREHGDVAQRVEINYENNLLKWWVLRLFGLRFLRRSRTVEEQGRYFIVRRGVSEIMKEAIGLLNDKAGYVYLVDGEGRIRWAGSAEAEEREKENMVKGLRRLVQEAKTPKGKKKDYFEMKDQLQAVVADVTGEVPAEKPAAAAAG
ncbi:hypothetical protein LTR08_006926 [Meristemomyces frigidus]|nr:hypothetical protein LTR08_006926 [Meristemomyces frigidus]